MTETPVADAPAGFDPGAEFARLMSGAQQAADIEAGADPEAPYGWTTDPKTGERRPKKSPGRPRKPRTAEELRAEGPPPAVPPDETPGRLPRGARGPRDDAEPAEMPKAGVIAKGVNKVYRRAGRIIRAMDHDIGQAVIECTRPDPEDPDWLTVGEAWEQVARTSPRIRGWLLRVIAGGAWGDLVMAHAPIGVAIAMKPVIMRILPFRKLIQSMTSDEDGDGGDLGGLTAEDVETMAAQAGLDVEAMAERLARRMNGTAGGVPVSAEVEAAARRVADEARLPPGFRRQQPKRSSRAARGKAGAR